MLTAAFIVYAIGVLVGLLRVDATPITRVTVALLWPVGAAAGVITVTALLLAALVLFPLFGAAVALVVGGWWLAG